MNALMQMCLILGVALICCTRLTQANVLFRFALNFTSDKSDTESDETNSAALAEAKLSIIPFTIIFENGDISINNNDKANSNEVEKEDQENDTFTSATVAPFATEITNTTWDDIWSQRDSLNIKANNQLQLTRHVIAKVQQEIQKFSANNPHFANKLKLTSDYLKKVDDVNTENIDVSTDPKDIRKKFDILREYINLVEDLIDSGRTQNTLNDVIINAGVDESNPTVMERTLMRLLLEKLNVFKIQDEIEEEVLRVEEAWQKYVKTKLIEVAL